MIRATSKVTMVSSSPGRAAEKLPTPALARLLRGKSGSRSRGRSSSSYSRSSPMFMARRRNASSSSVEIHDEKEPSSPKVTCIGQVRIRKKNKKNSSSSSSSASRSKQQQQQCCRCLERGFFCNPFSRKLKIKGHRLALAPAPAPANHPHHGWRRWFFAPRSRSCRQRKAQAQQQLLQEDRPRTPLRVVPPARAESEPEPEREDDYNEDEEQEEESKVFVSATPPKNALLLMRCRSAPHQASSPFSNRFWASSPSSTEDAVAAVPMEMESNRNGAEGFFTKSKSRNSSATEESNGGASERSGEEELDDGEEEEETAAAAAVGPSPSFSSRPLILTRCKSEPARRAAKLAAPEAAYCFWNAGGGVGSGGKSKNNARWLALVEEAYPPHAVQ